MQISEEYTTLDNFRFERKYVVENKSVSYVVQLIKLNPLGFKSIFKKRRINNVYFDSPTLTNYYDNHFGKSERVKIRIRWYGETFEKAEKPILEFKIKRGLAGIKKSYPLASFQLKAPFNKWDWDKIFKDSNLPEEVMQEVHRSVPTLLNTYERQYFQSFDKHYRFTVDANMKFYELGRNTTNFSRVAEERGTVVLELKYDMDKEKGLRTITNSLPVRLGKFSKYVRGIELFHSYLAV